MTRNAAGSRSRRATRRARANSLLIATLLYVQATAAPAAGFGWRYFTHDPGLAYFVGASVVQGVIHADFDGDGSAELATCGTHRGLFNSMSCAFVPLPASVPPSTSINPFATGVARVTLGTGFLGAAIGVGDVDGDGFDDFAATVGRTNASANLFVFLGPIPAGSIRRAEDLDGSNGFAVRLAPASTSGGFNGGLAVLDFDGDGLHDIAVGQPHRGKVLVIRGRPTWPALLDLLAGGPAATPGVIEIGPVEAPVVVHQQRLLAARLDADELTELVIVEPGRLHVVRGTTTPAATYDLATLTPAAGATLAVPGLFDAASADASGDGRADLAFSSTTGLYVLFGRADGALPGAGWPALGDDGYVHAELPAGYLESVPDLSGDGRDEWALTQVRRIGSESHVVLGRDLPGAAPSCLQGSAGFMLAGPSGVAQDLTYNYPAERVFGLADRDGDGRGALFVRGRILEGARLGVVFADGLDDPCG